MFRGLFSSTPSSSPSVTPSTSLTTTAPANSNLLNQDVINQAQAMFSMAQAFLRPYIGDINEFFDKVIKLVQDPAVTTPWNRFNGLIKPVILNATNIVLKKWHKDTHAIHRLIYFTLAQEDQIEVLNDEINDPTVRAAFLNRLAHIIDLESIFCKNAEEITDTYLSYVFNSQHQIQIAKMGAKNRSFHSQLGGNITKLYDFLPLNKFSILFSQPQALWEDGKYAKYKAETTLPFIRESLRSLYGQGMDEVMNLNVSQCIFNLRLETIKIYDLLAEDNAQLIQYCQGKQYSDQQLFALNKNLTLEVLKRSLKNKTTQDFDMQAGIENFLQVKIDYVEKQDTWLVPLSIVQEVQLHQIDLISWIKNDPTLYLDVLVGAFEKFNVPQFNQLIFDLVKPKTITKLLNLVASSFPALPLPKSGQISAFIDQQTKGKKLAIYRIVQNLKKAQKGGPASLKNFLRTELMTNSMLASMISPKERSIIELEAKYESCRETEHLKFLAQTGKVEEALPLLKNLNDFTALFLTALEHQQAEFCLELLKIGKKKYKANPDFFSLVPDESKDQEQVLRASLNFIIKNEEQGLEILSNLMEYKTWNKKLIGRFANETGNLKVRNLLLPDTNSATKSSTEAKTESSVPSQQLVTALVPKTPKHSPALFTPIALTDVNFIDKMQIFAEAKCEENLRNVQGYGLVMSLIQFFQSYYVTKKDNLIPKLTVEQARRVRNALVHQQTYEAQSGAVSLLLDGEADNLISLTKALVIAYNYKDSTALLKEPLFQKMLDHGAVLANQQQANSREQIKLYNRMRYTQWLTGASSALHKIQDSGQLAPGLLAHARAALNILRQIYCLRESSCALSKFEREQAIILRHMNDKLSVNCISESKALPKPKS